MLTTAGVAKELGEATPRRDLITAELRSLKAKYGISELVLLSHQDCGKYGGSIAFAGPLAEAERYCSDMTAASAVAIGLGLDVRRGTILLEDDSPTGIKMMD